MNKPGESVRLCPVCRSSNFSSWYDVTYEFIIENWNYDADYLRKYDFHKDSVIQIVRCNDCSMYYNRTHWGWAYKDNDINHTEKLPPLINSNIKKSTSNFHLVSRILNYYMHKINKKKFSDADLKVLDFSCFTGLLLRQLWAFGIRNLYGYDILKGPEDNFEIPNVDYTYNDLDLLETKGPFDIIINQASLEHYDDPLEVLKKLRALLSPGGILVIGAPTLNYYQFPFFKWANLRKGRAKSYFHAKHINHFSVKTFSKILQNAGLKILPVTMTFPSHIDYLDWNELQTIYHSARTAIITLVRVIISYPFFIFNWYPELFMHLYFSSYFICKRGSEK